MGKGFPNVACLIQEMVKSPDTISTLRIGHVTYLSQTLTHRNLSHRIAFWASSE